MNRVSVLLTLALAFNASSAQAQWTYELAPTGDMVAISEFAVPTTAGDFRGTEVAGVARAMIVCGDDGNHVAGISLPAEIEMPPGTIPIRVNIDGWTSSQTDGLVASSALIFGSTFNGVVSRIMSGNMLHVRMGTPTDYMTWSWPLRGSRAAIRNACGRMKDEEADTKEEDVSGLPLLASGGAG